MSSIIKKTGLTGQLLTVMAKRGGSMISDRSGFPPSKVFLPLRQRGLVQSKRSGLPRSKTTRWSLTPKGWAATGMSPPVYENEIG